MKTVYIHNFKGIGDYSFDGFKRFNLLVGMNNTGKSSFLEALYLYCNSFSPASVSSILRSRGYLDSVKMYDISEDILEAMTSLVSGRNLESFYRTPIVIRCDGHEVGCKMVNRVASSSIKEDGLFEIQEFDESSDVIEVGDVPSLLVRVDGKKAMSYTLNRLSSSRIRSEYGQRCQLVRTSMINRTDNPFLFDRITMTPYEKNLIPALRIINPKISAINFLKTDSSIDRVPYVAQEGVNSRCRLSSMGDGMNRLLTIILALLNCENGVLLLDEFENGLHYSVQEKLWEIIMKLSDDLNVQIFATTHSNDCLKSFVSSGAYKNGVVVRLEDIDGHMSSVPLVGERLSFALENSFDVR